jgi:hypothetical protein
LIKGKVSFYLAYSKFYPQGSRYWYGIKEEDFVAWERFERAFVVFILANSEEIISIPAHELNMGLKNSYITPTSGSRYKVHILRKANKFRFLEIQDLEINPYYNYFNQINISSASDYDDSDHQTSELPKEYLISPRRVYGRGGESEEHKRLKEYVAANPSIIGIDASEFIVQTEFILPSLDTMDVLFTSTNNRVEVKSRISNIDDITRGLFQCIKYTALLSAFHLAEKKDYKLKVILVLENPFPEQLIELKNILGIEVIDNIKAQENR